VKWNPFGRILLLANVHFPLNEDGLRAAFIPTVGVEYSF
jgi:hypothetical protein